MTRRGVRSVGAALVTLALALPSAGQNRDPGDRSMEFRPGLGESHERVPGGRLLVAAYAAVLLVLGGYVGFIARKAARIDEELRRLEDDLERRRGGGEA